MSVQIENKSDGYTIGSSAADQKVGFFGTTPVVQPGGSGVLQLPLMSFLDEGAGTTAALAIFADGASNVPGFTNLSSEGLGIRWNNSATPNPIITSVVKPNDLDSANDVVLHILAVRSATDASDLVTFDVTAFDNVAGAAAAADADLGGTSTAMSDDVLIQELTVTLAAADISATQGAIGLTIQPTDGTLATIDVTILGAWIEYTNGLVNLGLYSGS